MSDSMFNRNTPTAYHVCDWCHQSFIPKRRDAKTCSPACRQAIYRYRKAKDIRWYETATQTQLRRWREERQSKTPFSVLPAEGRAEQTR